VTIDGVNRWFLQSAKNNYMKLSLQSRLQLLNIIVSGRLVDDMGPCLHDQNSNTSFFHRLEFLNFSNNLYGIYFEITSLSG